jgi:lysozyme
VDDEDFFVLAVAGVGLYYLWPYIKPGAASAATLTSPGGSIASGQGQVSEAGIAFIKREEGFRANVYNDVGHKAYGYGHDFTGAPPYPPPITEYQADQLLRSDLATASAQVDSLVTVPLSQNQFDALVSFQFNTGALGSSTLLRLLNSGDYAGAAGQFGRWIHAGGAVSSVLVGRRAREAALFNS